MRERTTQECQFPSKGTSLSIAYGGKVYLVVSAGQYRYVRENIEEQIQRENLIRQYEKKPLMTPQEKEQEVLRRLEEQPCCTLKAILAKMTPQEREAWMASYRFSPVIRTKPA
jgi:hypothetical protein